MRLHKVLAFLVISNISAALADAPLVFQQRCVICHGQSIPFDDLIALKTDAPNFATSLGPRYVDEIIRRTRPDADPLIRMPFNQDPLSDEELKSIADYLKN